MLTQEDDVDIHALRSRGWSISAIARHVGRDRKTVRAYLEGKQVAGQRKPAGPDAFAPFVDYCAARLTEDPHLWAVVLFDEVAALGYDRSFPTFTRAIRARALRPGCPECLSIKDRPVAVILHEPGAETQWDWVDLPNPPASWDGYGKMAHLLVGALSHSSKWRGVLCESTDQAQLAAAQHTVAVKLGGITHDWRFDRMSTVVDPTTGKVTASYAAIAKYFGVSVKPCPPRRGNRKGVVEKANHTAAQRWWRTLSDDVTAGQAQTALDVFCERTADMRQRRDAGGNRCTVADLAATEPLRPVPAAPPIVTIESRRVATGQALVHYRGNTYSIPPEFARADVIVTHRPGSPTIAIATVAGVTVAVHHRAADGAGAQVRAEQHVTALNIAAMAAAGDSAGRPHRRKERIPPGPAAKTAAAVLRGAAVPVARMIDLAVYAQAAATRRTAP